MAAEQKRAAAIQYFVREMERALVVFKVPLEDTANTVDLPDLDEEDDADGELDSGMDFAALQAAAYTYEPVQDRVGRVQAAVEQGSLFARASIEEPEEAGSAEDDGISVVSSFSS